MMVSIEQIPNSEHREYVMSQIVWSEDFVLGIETFDAHHQHLISLINETTLCLEKGTSQTDLNIIINSLVDYAWYHFNAEEAWMKSQQYPQLEVHQKIHKEFSHTIQEFQGRLSAGEGAVAEELSTYLNFWLIDHIVICDSQYASFAGSRREPVLMT
jgi:hemerythrin-like metal-binding protein